MQERLQKIISSSGLMSRRSAEKCISDCRVTVNGVTASIGDKADPEHDDIRIDGNPVAPQDKLVYVLLNKPKGYVTTMSDEKGRRNVSQLVEGVGVRIYPVGRLDINSEGLLIMTNDGAFANQMMHPSGNVLKTYRVRVGGEDLDRSLAKLSEPILLDGVSVTAKKISVLKREMNEAVLDITIGEGRNRQIRRMCDYAGLYVKRLCRIQEGSLSLGALKSGEWRYLTEAEVLTLSGGEAR